MKKLTIIFAALLLSVGHFQSTYAQEFYITPKLGFGAKLGSQSLPYLNFANYTVSANNNNVEEEQLFVSLGKGVSYGADFGLMFNDNIGLELGLYNFRGSDLTSSGEYSGGTEELTIKSKMFKVIPSLILSTNKGAVRPYGKFGLVMGFGSFDTHYINEDQGAMDLTVVTEFTGGTSFGINTGMGLIFKLSEKLSIVTELNFTNLSYSPKTGEVVEARLSNQDILDDLSTSARRIEFVDELSYSLISDPVESQPTEAFKQKVPFGSLSFDFGLRIGF